MPRTLQRAARDLTAAVGVALLSACYTAAPAPQATGPAATHAHVSYASPPGSIGIAIYSSAPPPHVHDGAIWYYGNHPHPANRGLGPFCNHRGSHRHDYVPYRGHRYVYYDDHYFWVGDARPYSAVGSAYPYYGHHPHPHYFGGTCRIRGLHQHQYPPNSASYYRMKSGAYFFTGVYGNEYYDERDEYDALGRKGDQLTRGYHEHERAKRDARVSGAHRDGGAAVDTDASPASEGSVPAAAAAARARSRALEQQRFESSPDPAVDSPERFEIHQVTPQELLERMRARSRSRAEGAAANAAD